jgi:hypothetical protein
MFGTDRAIKRFQLDIRPMADPAEQAGELIDCIVGNGGLAFGLEKIRGVRCAAS